MVSRWLLRKCTKCGVYTLNREHCPRCGGSVHIPHPPKFSPEDKYSKYRRMLKTLSGLDQRGSDQVTAA